MEFVKGALVIPFIAVSVHDRSWEFIVKHVSMVFRADHGISFWHGCLGAGCSDRHGTLQYASN